MKYIIANWKANKNCDEALSWIESLVSNIRSSQSLTQSIDSKNLKLIICPPSPLLSVLKLKDGDSSLFSIGAQNISEFDQGSFTGEVPAYSLKGLAEYVIIGHSERRTLFHEESNTFEKKVELATKYGLKTIFCIRDENDFIPEGVSIIAYEPPSAIGTGAYAKVEDVVDMKAKIKLPLPYIYGGSVDKKNIKSYLVSGAVDGFLIGKASLSSTSLFEVLLESLT